MTAQEVQARADYVRLHAGELGRARWALVVARDVDYGMGRMAEAVLSGTVPEVPLQVFRDVAEAEAWVRGAVESP